MKKVIFLLFFVFLASSGSMFLYLKTYHSGFVSYSYDDSTQTVTYEHSNRRPKNWVKLSSMNKSAYGGIIVSEDWGFYSHKGLDFLQLKKAVLDAASGKRLRGASTITQQLAKNLFLSHERSFLRKLVEAYIAVFIELALDKKRILELYLNIVEFGKGIYGIGDAGLYYFSKLPHELGPREGAFLAMLLPNPKVYSQSFRDKEMTDFANESVKEILYKMKVAQFISEEVYERELEKSFNWEPQTAEMSDLEYYLNQ